MSDLRYIVICEDGRYAFLGRHTVPTREAVQQAEARMVSQELRGWYATASGSFHRARKPVLTPLQPLNAPACTFADAAAKAGGRVAP